jgi:hypothetical protein
MRNKFPGYYRLSDAELTKLVDECAFSFDANILLHIYRFTDDSREKFFQILEKLGGRVWITYQAAEEFQRGRLGVITKQEEAYNDLCKSLESTKSTLTNSFNEFTRHPLINTEDYLKSINVFFTDLSKKLTAEKEEHPELHTEDPYFERLTKVLDGKVGDPFGDSDLKACFKEGAARYGDSVPPGYADRPNKKGNEKFGDYVVWKQLIDYSKAHQKPVIFVTDDMKEDWWRKFNGKTLGPRPELVREFRQQTGQTFYMYNSFQFMKYVGEKLQLGVKQETLDEATNLGRNQLLDAGESRHIAAEGIGSSQPSDISQILKALSEAYVKSQINRLRIPSRTKIEEYLHKHNPYALHMGALPIMKRVVDYIGENPIRASSEEQLQDAFSSMVDDIKNDATGPALLGLDVSSLGILQTTGIIDYNYRLTTQGIAILQSLCN